MLLEQTTLALKMVLVVCLTDSVLCQESSKYSHTSNDTIGIIVDPRFMPDKTSKVIASIKQKVNELREQELKQGVLNVEYFWTTRATVNAEYTGLVIVAACPDVWRIYRDNEENNLFYLVITESDCPRLPSNEAVTLPLGASGSEISQILLDLRTSRALNWKTVNLIHDDSVDRDLMGGFIGSLTKEMPSKQSLPSFDVVVFNFLTTDAEWEKTKRIHNLLSSIRVKRDNSNYMAKSLGLVNPINQWLFIVPDTKYNFNVTTFGNLLGEGENVAFAYNSSTATAQCVGGLSCHVEEILRVLVVAIDKSSTEEYELSNQVSEEEWEAIKPSKVERRNSLVMFLRARLNEARLNEVGKCDICTMWSFKSGETWGEEFQENTDATIDLLDVGVWTPRDGLRFSDVLFPHIEQGFRGKNLPVISFHFPPWQIITANPGEPIQYKGVIFEVLNQLARNLNFTYTVLIASNNTEGYTNGSYISPYVQTLEGEQDASPTANPTWDKMIDFVSQKRVFLAAAAFTHTYKHENIINYTAAISVEPYVFLVARPRELSKTLLFTAPFTPATWLCIGVSILVTIPLLYCLHMISPYYEHYKIREQSGFHKFSNCVWYIYGALLQQGGGKLPEADSGRLVIGTWWLFVLVIVTTYCDSVVARIRSGSHVFIQRKTTLLYLLKKQFQKSNSCDFSLGDEEFAEEQLSMVLAQGRDEEFAEEQLSMVLAQGSAYMPVINREHHSYCLPLLNACVLVIAIRIGRMHRVGLIHKWLQDYLPKKDKCWSESKSAQGTNHMVNLNDMQGSFFVLIIGCIAGGISISIEFCLHMYKVSKERSVIHPFVS
uniref:Ionotropic receptor 1 n=1 Tax=Diaphorina citri TaxID=121845 RepID=A0A7T3UZ93_DIACI|nr:ionotropic receptor 1 [Diaphorina citri]